MNANDTAIVEHVCRDVPAEKVEAYRKIHLDALRGHEKRRTGLLRELAALDRATEMRKAALQLLEVPAAADTPPQGNNE